MPVQQLTPILNVSSILDSQKWFEALGWQRGFTWPDGDPAPGFGAVCSEKAEIFLCRGAQGSRGTIMPKFPGNDETDGVWVAGLPDTVDLIVTGQDYVAEGATVEPVMRTAEAGQ